MNAKKERPHPVATAFFTVLGNLGLVVGTIVFGFLASILGWLPPRGRWMYLCAWLWSHLLIATSGVRVRASFEEPLEKKKGYVFMANHESMFDIPSLIMTLPGETRMLAKRSLFRIPFFGWGLHAGGFIPVDRGDREGAKRTFAAAVRCLEQGRSILLFPEERRTEDGTLLPFKPGGFLMALKTGFPIVPVGIRGTREARAAHTYLNYPGPAELRYGAPIPVEGLSVRDRKALMEQVRERIAELREAPAEDGVSSRSPPCGVAGP